MLHRRSRSRRSTRSPITATRCTPTIAHPARSLCPELAFYVRHAPLHFDRSRSSTSPVPLSAFETSRTHQLGVVLLVDEHLHSDSIDLDTGRIEAFSDGVL